MLAEPEQVLRCRVAHYERAGDLPGAARLLESRERFEAAVYSLGARRRWSGHAAAARALQEQRRGSMLTAAEDWDALGEPKRARGLPRDPRLPRRRLRGRRARLRRRRPAEMALTSRVLAAKLKMDYEAAERAVVESGLPDMRKALIGDRAIWLAQAERWPRRRSGRGPRGPKAEALAPALRNRDGPHPEDRASAGSGPRRAPDPTELATAIVDAVTRYPGLTCERIADVVHSPTDPIKPHLAALTASGRLRKVGRARGTRYHLA